MEGAKQRYAPYALTRAIPVLFSMYMYVCVCVYVYACMFDICPRFQV